jgi:hypothetical protein
MPARSCFRRRHDDCLRDAGGPPWAPSMQRRRHAVHCSKYSTGAVVVSNLDRDRKQHQEPKLVRNRRAPIAAHGRRLPTHTVPPRVPPRRRLTSKLQRDFFSRFAGVVLGRWFRSVADAPSGCSLPLVYTVQYSTAWGPSWRQQPIMLLPLVAAAAICGSLLHRKLSLPRPALSSSTTSDHPRCQCQGLSRLKLHSALINVASLM